MDGPEAGGSHEQTAKTESFGTDTSEQAEYKNFNRGFIQESGPLVSTPLPERQDRKPGLFSRIRNRFSHKPELPQSQEQMANEVAQKWGVPGEAENIVKYNLERNDAEAHASMRSSLDAYKEREKIRKEARNKEFTSQDPRYVSDEAKVQDLDNIKPVPPIEPKFIDDKQATREWRLENRLRQNKPPRDVAGENYMSLEGAKKGGDTVPEGNRIILFPGTETPVDPELKGSVEDVEEVIGNINKPGWILESFVKNEADKDPAFPDRYDGLLVDKEGAFWSVSLDFADDAENQKKQEFRIRSREGDSFNTKVERSVLVHLQGDTRRGARFIQTPEGEWFRAYIVTNPDGSENDKYIYFGEYKSATVNEVIQLADLVKPLMPQVGEEIAEVQAVA